MALIEIFLVFWDRDNSIPILFIHECFNLIYVPLIIYISHLIKSDTRDTTPKDNINSIWSYLTILSFVSLQITVILLIRNDNLYNPNQIETYSTKIAYNYILIIVILIKSLLLLVGTTKNWEFIKILPSQVIRKIQYPFFAYLFSSGIYIFVLLSEIFVHENALNQIPSEGFSVFPAFGWESLFAIIIVIIYLLSLLIFYLIQTISYGILFSLL